MKRINSLLLAIDATANLLIGFFLLFFPIGIFDLLGLPADRGHFYATILGGVVFGIGIALCIEYFGAPRGVRGLGLGGAAAINVCGAGVLVIRLMLGGFYLPARGLILLWIVAGGILAIGIAEIAFRSWRCDD